MKLEDFLRPRTNLPLTLNEVEKRINKMVERYANDYPDWQKKNVFERLWALEATIKGLQEANKDLHGIIWKINKMSTLGK